MKKRNALYNVGASILQMVIALVSVPAYLKLVGMDRYGAIVALLLLMTYIGIFDLGAGRFAAYRFAAPTSPQQRFSSFTTTLIVAVSVSVVSAFVVYLALPGVVMPFLFGASRASLDQEILLAAKYGFLTVPFTTIAAVSVGALDGQGRFGASNAVSILAAAGLLLGPMISVSLVGGSVEVAFIGILVSKVVFAMAGVVTVLTGGVTARSRFFDVDEARLAGRYGGWLTITNLLAPVLNSADQLIITAAAGVSALPYYSIPVGAVGRASIIPGGMARAIFPHMASSSQEQADAAAREVLHSTAVIMTLLCLLGLVWIDVAFSLWLGRALVPSMVDIGHVALIGIWANAFAYVPAFVAQARGRARLIALIHASEALPYLGAMLMMSRHYGAMGAVVVWAGRHCIDAVLHVMIVRVRVSIFRDVLPFAVGVSCVVAWSTFVGESWGYAGKVVLSLGCLVLCASGLAGMFGTSRLSRFEDRLRRLIRRS